MQLAFEWATGCKETHRKCLGKNSYLLRFTLPAKFFVTAEKTSQMIYLTQALKWTKAQKHICSCHTCLAKRLMSLPLQVLLCLLTTVCQNKQLITVIFQLGAIKREAVVQDVQLVIYLTLEFNHCKQKMQQELLRSASQTFNHEKRN